MPDLFRACVDVLWGQLRPIHYAQLTDAALLAMKWPPLAPDERKRVIEDVREKMLLARQHGTFYVPRPHCLAAVSEWFPGPSRPLWNVEALTVEIKASYESWLHATINGMCRSRYMITKRRDTPLRWEGAARGFVIEQHVSDWFRSHWPDFWLSPENILDHRSSCDHDFRMKVRGRTLKFDVMGPHWDGLFALGGKTRVDYHLVASADPSEDKFHLHGVLKRLDVPADSFGPEKTQPISWLVVWLNCLKHDLDYPLIQSYAAGKAPSLSPIVRN